MAKRKVSAALKQSKLKEGSVSIKDVVVADPSIEFVLEIDPNEFTPSEDGIYLKNLEIQLSISNIDPKATDKLKLVGAILVSSVTQIRPYFYFSFGDANYTAGTEFTLCFQLSAYSPVTGEPIQFSNNPMKVKVIGGGLVK